MIQQLYFMIIVSITLSFQDSQMPPTPITHQSLVRLTYSNNLDLFHHELQYQNVQLMTLNTSKQLDKNNNLFYIETEEISSLIFCDQYVTLHAYQRNFINVSQERSFISKQKLVGVTQEKTQFWQIICQEKSKQNQILKSKLNFLLQFLAGMWFWIKNQQENCYLTSNEKYKYNLSNCGDSCPFLNEQEVYCDGYKTESNKWKIQSVFFLSQGLIYEAKIEDQVENYENDQEL